MFWTLIPIILSGSLASVIVETQFGKVFGELDDKADVASFKGIPYAKAPIGNHRFADTAPWTDKYPSSGLDATKFGATCLESEDCLFMNIYAPSQPSHETLKPVLFFIHGGAFVMGAGSDYDGTYLAKKHGAVVVTFNYRLGALGWVQLVNGSANFGLKDQREAMRFARQSNAGAPFISAFGGDISRMMMFGESAGAISVAVHLVTPKSFGLFTSALMESGFPSAMPPHLASERGANFSRLSGCGDAAAVLTCMRQKNISTLKAAEAILTPATANLFTTVGWGPVIDLVDITNDPLVLISEGALAKVPVIAGTNTNEAIAFLYPWYPLGMSINQYKQFVHDFLSTGYHPFNESVYERALKVYPPSHFDNRETASNLIADATFICGTREVMQHAEKSFLYHFDYGTRPVYHGAELDYVFEDGKLGHAGEHVAETMGKFWATFAATGTPATEKVWPSYTNATDSNIVFGSTVTVESGRRSKYCNFWEGAVQEGFRAPNLVAMFQSHPKTSLNAEASFSLLV